MMFPFRWGWDWGWGLASVVGSIVLLVILVIPWFFFLLNLQNLLLRVDPRNRAMPAGHVWLNFIPVFNLGWFLYTVIKVRDSVRAEYLTRGWTPEGDQGYNVGLVTGVLAIASFILGWIPGIGWAIAIAQLICWILYWLKTNELKNRLGVPGAWSYSFRGGYGGERPGSGFAAGPPPYQQYSGQQPPAQQRPAPQPSPQAGAWTQPPAPSAQAAPPSAATQPPAPARAASQAVPPEAPASAPAGTQESERTWSAPPVWPSSPASTAAGAGPAMAAAAGESGGGASAAQERELMCAACGTKYAAGDKFCRTCGLRLPE